MFREDIPRGAYPILGVPLIGKGKGIPTNRKGFSYEPGGAVFRDPERSEQSLRKQGFASLSPGRSELASQLHCYKVPRLRGAIETKGEVALSEGAGSMSGWGAGGIRHGAVLPAGAVFPLLIVPFWKL